MRNLINLALGGVAGTFSRYFLAAAVNRAMGPSFPYGTMAVNLSGCLLIGLFDGMAEIRLMLGPAARLLLMTGFCGAYTTFSTLILESSILIKDGETWRAFLNFMGSGALGFVLFRLGVYLGGTL